MILEAYIKFELIKSKRIKIVKKMKMEKKFYFKNKQDFAML